jgi:tRNA dimethylallyltransferase
VAALRREPRAQERRSLARVDRMLAAGLLDEVRGLQARAPFAAEPSRAIGYREALEHLAGRLDAAGLRERMLVRTRQLVRKQRLHLQGLPEVRWIDVGEGETVTDVAARVERVLDA